MPLFITQNFNNSRHIPGALAARIPLINQAIQDDEFDDVIREVAESEPDRDMRPFIAEWLDRVMPDQKYRFREDPADQNTTGLLSPVHGYTPKKTAGR